MDNRKTYIYDSYAKKLTSLNYSVEEFRLDPESYFPDWENTMIATSKLYNNPKVVDGELIEKTRLELVLEGSEQLNEGEVIQNNEIAIIPKPSEMLKPIWVVAEWVESATQEEIEQHKFKQSVAFYNSELEFASKATAELACEIITEDMFLSVKEYMKAIDPYGQPTRTFSVPVRPPVFDRYQ